MSELNGSVGGERRKGPLRRTLDVCVFAPVGLAVTVVEDLPEIVAKGRQRVELELSNARIVGRFVVTQKQREVSERLDDMLRDASPREAEDGAMAPAPPSPGPPPRPAAQDGTGDAQAATEPVAPPPRPAPDSAAAAIIGEALADYDTLSASQVVRRLEGLGADELRAVQRYEASHRNRRTILNRAGQLLDEGLAGRPGD